MEKAMNCDTCGILYRDDTPHPPSVCASHAGAELKKKTAALDGALEKISTLSLERRGFQIMSRNMLLTADQAFWRSAMDEGKYFRGSGDVQCSICRLPYIEHPELPGFPTFHIICDHDIVKT